MATYPSWGWTTGAAVGNQNEENFIGYTFSPNDIYTEGSLRDGDDDGRVAPRGSGAFHPNDGWSFGGQIYQTATNWTFTATVTNEDGTTADVNIWGTRLVETNNDASAPLHSTMMFRLPDTVMYNTADGGTDDGDGAYQYAMEDITSIEITGVVGEADWRPKENMDEFWPEVVCFATGTMIRTTKGILAVETLQSGDMVLTRDNGLQPIRWIGSRKLSTEILAAAPHLRPIRIKAGSLGRNIPVNDLIVSPQHRVLVRSKIAQRMFGTDEVLVAAKQLLDVEGIDIAEDIHEVEYFHFMFDRHEIVFSNGAEAESLYTGPVALRSVSPDSRKEILSLFPELGEDDFETQPARLLATGRQGRRLAYRHARNQQEMVY